MNRYIILITLLLLSASTKAQLNISYSVGYGQYQMRDMKNMAKTVEGSINWLLGEKLKMTDNFPAYITHNGEVTYQLNQHEFGISGDYMTSGSEYAYADYSGNYSAKIVAEAFKIGLMYKFHFYNTKIAEAPFSVFLSLIPSAVLTDVKVKEEVDLHEQNLHEKMSEDIIKSKFGFSMQPMVGCRLIFFDHLLIQTSAGYDFELGTRINPTYRVDWSGFRLNGGLGIRF